MGKMAVNNRLVLPREILSVDVAIIDDQPDHLVLTVRVPKSVLARHHAILAALTDRAAPENRANHSGPEKICELSRLK